MSNFTIVRRAAKLRAKTVLSANLGLCVAVTAITGVISFLGGIATSYFLPDTATLMATEDVMVYLPSIALTQLLTVLFSLLICPLTIGTSAFFMSHIRDKKTGIPEIFTWFGETQKLKAALGATLWYLLISIGWTAVYLAAPGALMIWLASLTPIVGMSEGMNLLLLIGALLLFLTCAVFGEAKIMSYMPALYMVAETPQRGVRETFRTCAALMRGRKWEFFVLQLSFILWYLTSLFTCGLSMLYVVPYEALTISAFTAHIQTAGKGTPPPDLLEPRD